MNSVNKTLYIPLYGKAYVSKRGLFLNDKKAEEIWEKEGFLLKGKSKSKWLAYYMGIRSAVFDKWLKKQMADIPNAVVIHVGCGLDSRILRIENNTHKWYDVDFLEVINERKRYYTETDNYKMIAGDLRDCSFLTNIEEKSTAIVVMEGVSMYVSIEEMQDFFNSLCSHFDKITLLLDAYTLFASKISKIKNPIKSVGKIKVYGIDDPKDYQTSNLIFAKEHEMTPKKYINELKGLERFYFAKLYAGSISKKLYRLYEYKSKK